MPLPSNPPFIPDAFAHGAAGSFITNPIPETTATPGAASFNLGFPPLTMTPEVGGGVPPFGQDFNGILFMMSSHLVYLEQGLLYQFSSAVASAIGGYAVGTILLSTDGNTVWYNKSAANSTDPDGGSPAGWVPLYSYGITSVAGVSGGTVTLTPAQGAKLILKVTGALTGDTTIVVPTQVQQWLVANATSGAFNVTVKTAAGTGVVIPQSGVSAPSSIYGDGTNIYLTSISTAGLAPINSPAFTGIPTAPTPPVSSNTTQLATTAFVKNLLGGSVTTFRVGTFNIVSNNSGTATFSSPFPNACLGAVASVPIGGFQPGCSVFTASNFHWNGAACSTQTAQYIAWGN